MMSIQAPTIDLPSFTVGDDAISRTAGRKVARIINVNIQIRQRDRECTAAIGLHEWPLIRRRYEAAGGDVTLLATWVPGVPRDRTLTEQQLKDELARLESIYVIPREGGKRELVAEVYGVAVGERLTNLQKTMNDIADKWSKLYSSLRKRVLARNPRFIDECVAAFNTHKSRIPTEALNRYADARMIELTGYEMTDRDLTDIVSHLEQDAVSVGEIELPELGVPPVVDAPIIDPNAPVVLPAPSVESVVPEEERAALAASLRTAGFDESQSIDLIKAYAAGDIEVETIMELPSINKSLALARRASRVLKGDSAAKG